MQNIDISDIDKLVDVIVLCRPWKQGYTEISIYYVLNNNSRSFRKAAISVMR